VVESKLGPHRHWWNAQLPTTATTYQRLHYRRPRLIIRYHHARSRHIATNPRRLSSLHDADECVWVISKVGIVETLGIVLMVCARSLAVPPRILRFSDRVCLLCSPSSPSLPVPVDSVHSTILSSPPWFLRSAHAVAALHSIPSDSALLRLNLPSKYALLPRPTVSLSLAFPHFAHTPPPPNRPSRSRPNPVLCFCSWSSA